MNREDLQSVWKEIEKSYNDECINSERALQAMLYHYLTERLSYDHLIFVEPTWHPKLQGLDGKVPDLLIVRRESESIDCIMEIKCVPHWIQSKTDVDGDFDKLKLCTQLVDSYVEVDVFGPNIRFNKKSNVWERFDNKQNIWVNGRRKYAVTQLTLFCFADIAKKESLALDKDNLIRAQEYAVASHPNFVLLAGATDPDVRRAEFKVQ